MGNSKAERRLPLDGITIHSTTGVSLDFVYIGPGEYVVGRPIARSEVAVRAIGQAGSPLDEGPERHITFEKGFYLCRCQITADQFAKFLNDVDAATADRSIVLNERSNIEMDAGGEYVPRKGAVRYPANTVTWDGAVEFARWFATRSEWSVRLPSEDAWEAASRTPRGDLGPTGGADRLFDSKTGLTQGIRPGTPDVDIDAFSENVTRSGLIHTINAVGDWTSDVYRSDRGKQLPDTIVAEDNTGHVLKRCLNRPDGLLLLQHGRAGAKRGTAATVPRLDRGEKDWGPL